MFPIVSDIWMFGPQLVTFFGRFRWYSLARGSMSLTLRLMALVPLCFLLATADVSSQFLTPIAMSHFPATTDTVSLWKHKSKQALLYIAFGHGVCVTATGMWLTQAGGTRRVSLWRGEKWKCQMLRTQGTCQLFWKTAVNRDPYEGRGKRKCLIKHEKL